VLLLSIEQKDAKKKVRVTVDIDAKGTLQVASKLPLKYDGRGKGFFISLV
jgi:hypothetical protein